MPMELFRRASALMLGTLLLCLSLFACWQLYQSDLEQRTEQLRQTLRSEAARDWALFSDRLLRYSSKLISLKLASVESGLFNEAGNPEQDISQRLFSQIFSDMPELVQARWLDAHGQEKLRFNRAVSGRQEASQIVASTILQDKSDRYYFREAIKLQSDQVYASNFDLNVEFGHIVEPYQPTLRLASPDRTASGELRGVMVLNFDVTSLFADLASSFDEHIMLQVVDQYGSWKLHTEHPELNWHDLLHNSGRSMATEAPQQFAKLVALQRGKRLPDDSPFELLQELPLNQIFATEYRLFMLAYIQPAAVTALHHEVISRALWYLALLLGISAAFVFWVRRSEQQRRKLLLKLQEQLRHTESASAYKSRFLANLNHEIRTPVTAVLGMVELLQSTDLKPDQKQRLDFIAASTEDLRKVVNDLMDFNNIEAGRVALHPRYFNLTEILEQTVQLFATSAELKDLELILEHDAELANLDIYSDSFRLLQVLNNLLSNAIKYTAKGSVRIKVRALSRQNATIQLLFEVIDTGVGIESAVVSQLSLPFDQGDLSITRKLGGTGFGLAIVNYMLSLFSSQLEIESSLSKGSRFSFVLGVPYRTVERLAPLENSNLAAKRVLVVDDQPLVANGLVHMLEHWGADVQSVFDATAGLDLVQQTQASETPYDVVMIDWQMAGGRGVDLIQRLKLNNELLDSNAPLRVVVLTSHSAEPQLATSSLYESGMCILHKPVTYSGLQAVLEQLGWVVVVGNKKQEDRAQIRDKLIRRLRDQLAYSTPPRILLVEDSKTNQLVVKELISSFGLSCDIAENGEQALMMSAGVKYDLILMDIQMPVMDGLTATREFRQRYSHKELPIIALSAATQDEDVIAAEAAGVNAHLAKPLDVLKLLNVIIQFWQPVLKANRTPQAAVESQLSVLSDVSGLDINAARQLLQCSPDFELDNTVYKWLGLEAYQRVCMGFLQDILPQLDYWRVSGGDQPDGQKRKFIHRLKSAAGNVGAFRLQALATQVDERLSLGEDVDISNLLTQLETVCGILKPLVGDSPDQIQSDLKG
ncbi:response regulator [Pontibacter sp. JAM-7]|uniref:hybrid sensor histidine kinase/response regulator n=1 Tax=Pontibacter sp. JAM-7 TaxID=3366581 RepID=UPI003AF68B3B